ncbi:hypothetical protein PUNSTDRAFT_139777 [Punctularia strigosozonata HHB-11173 SS5]|uniref:uncharacterized protein n=1 Tax=Punctularia strigosozonata (strain HHB-11173) TaxID=741275 RepID=UPI00044173BF|nr:uncharacterized protein PUNSTDRAFT_139777 [Punctularia strigosozonata HHB-11173 SS5]EIN13118.1 hypothetical protein PUNSTDRAFT_139777 [Punctularia strigosozonata HHB-11173 SS5]
MAGGFNYAKYLSIDSVAAAVIFAILYVPLACVFTVKLFRGFTMTRLLLTLFCFLRVGAFSLRGVLSGSSKAGENETLFIVYSVLYSAGFYWVLYSAYSLVLDRGDINGNIPNLGVISRVSRNRHLIHIVLVVAVGLGVKAAIDATSSNEKTRNESQGDRRISVIIYLVVAVLLAIQNVLLVMVEFQSPTDHRIPIASSMSLESEQRTFGARHASRLLAVITVLILIREVFFIATSSSFSTQNKEVLWYPLSASTEYIALAVFSIQGLLPTRAQLKFAEEAKKYGSTGVPLATQQHTSSPYTVGSAYSVQYPYSTSHA